MTRKFALIITAGLMLVLASIAALVSAQEIVPADDALIDPNANISFPPPVYVLRGEFDIYGSANVQGMTNYFIEFRPIEVLENPPEETDNQIEDPWFPVTLPNTQLVQNDVLGTWNTRTTPDGLYEMRLTINASGRAPVFFMVRPIRIENNPSPFAPSVPTAAPVVQATATLAPVTRPTLAPTPTAVDRTPRVTAALNANIRAGDGVNYRVVDTLYAGESARVIGISSFGSGWYYIEMQDGTRGWIAPSVVNASGDIGSVPRVNPPVTPTPTPTNTPVPSGNLTGSAPSLNPNPPTCNVQFQVLANITNNGTAKTNIAATVIIEDIHVATGQIQASVARAVPEMEPGANFVVGADLIISTFYNEEHRIQVRLDTGNGVPETNENDNVLSTTYVLQKGACP